MEIQFILFKFFLQIYIRSTDVNRTLISAMANVAGMFSSDPYNRDRRQESRNMSNLMWTPVPIHTVELSTDYVNLTII